MGQKNVTVDLNKIRIASPCTMSWAEMKGDDRVRHCGACQLNVYNVAGLSSAETVELLTRNASGERVCMRLSRRSDGTLLTNDCPVGVKLLRKARLKFASLCAMSLSALMWFGGLRALARSLDVRTPTISPSEMGALIAPVEPQVLMGKVRAEPQLTQEPPVSAPAEAGESSSDPEIEPLMGIVAPPATDDQPDDQPDSMAPYEFEEK